MSGWGIKDNKTASGTVAITTGGAVTGSSTAFTTEAAVGDFLRVGSQEFIIKSITDDETATVINANPQTTWTTVNAGASYTLSEKPTSLASDPSILSTNVFGVDATEMTITPGPAHAGWVKREEFGSAGRVRYETLVALSKNAAADMGDAEDVAFPDSTTTTTTTAAPTTTTTEATTTTTEEPTTTTTEAP